jgi:Fe-S-cluster-containing dehydrogenase component/CRP-like cAMP-binding protein
MADELRRVDKPERWDVPFDPKMTDKDVERLLTIPPFSGMDPAKFPKKIPLQGILQFDASLRRYAKGEIVVRQGDYGTSAFMVLSGTVQVVKPPGLAPSLLGRPDVKKRNLFRIFAQLWTGRRPPESGVRSRAGNNGSLGTESDEEDRTHVFLQDIPQILSQQETAPMAPGVFFGEIAALTRSPRSATVFANSDDVELLEIRWQGLRELKKYDKALDEYINNNYRQRVLNDVLKLSPIFGQLTKEVRDQVREQTEFATHGRYDWTGDYKKMVKQGTIAQGADEVVIAQEGDYPNGVVIIRAGFARLSKKYGNGQRTLSYLGAGQLYGWREIAHNWRKPEAAVPLQYTLRAVGYAHVLIIPTAVMERWVLPNLSKSRLPSLFGEAELKQAAVPSFDPKAKIDENMLEFLAEHRFFNGTKTMLIDLDRCTRCDDCVRACAATHDNNPRFLRHGPVQDNIMVANACMHCADPVCLIGCPTGAISRSAAGGEVVINPNTCIGCEACANNCPYDAIRMVEARDRGGLPVRHEEGLPIVIATKCDLCLEQYTGPACQKACPHDALVRMDMNRLEKFSDWLNRR